MSRELGGENADGRTAKSAASAALKDAYNRLVFDQSCRTGGDGEAMLLLSAAADAILSSTSIGTRRLYCRSVDTSMERLKKALTKRRKRWERAS
jgi:hypothetical protein